MPELQFKGKEFVYNHHLTVPFRPLEMHSDKGIGAPRLDGNLIIHGDNLHALKALLPMYAGKVDCIFIDPPYNTGNEGWSYNDNVNSPMIREWLNSNPIGLEDGLRHDKWCAMMWPRLRLLRELLSEHGSLWITLDDNEVHRAKSMLDEVFGEDSFIGQIAWQKRTSRENRAVLSPSIDHIIVYSRCLRDTWRIYRNRLEPDSEVLSNPDNDPRGPWDSVPFSAQGFRPNQVYEITTPTGKVLRPPRGRCWGATWDEFVRLRDVENRIYWPKDGDSRPRVKQFPEHRKGLVPDTLWMASEVGDTEESKKQLLDIFSDRDPEFHAPKPVALVQRVIQISTKSDGLVLDSFAGTAATAHAVLAENVADGGNRRFILVEMEEYADQLTAERVRRVINGYDFTGTQKTELLRKRLNWRALRNSADIVHKVEAIENLHGHEYDRIKKDVRDGELIVTGEKTVAERADGLGGTFTYCTLGEPVEMDAILSGGALPDADAMAGLLWHTATATPLEADTVMEAPQIGDGVTRLGTFGGRTFWMIYRPDLAWLKSGDAALSLAKARAISAAATGNHLVFAPAKFVSRELLAREKIDLDYAPLPFALYRLETA